MRRVGEDAWLPYEMVRMHELDGVLAQDEVDEAHILRVIRRQLVIRQGLECFHVPGALFVGDVDGPHRSVRELVERYTFVSGVAQEEPSVLSRTVPGKSARHVRDRSRIGLAAQDVDIVALPGQRPRQVACVLVAARPGELEAMEDSDPHRFVREVWNECIGRAARPSMIASATPVAL